MDWGKKWLVDFSARKSQLVLFDWSNNTGSINVKMDGSASVEKSSLKCCGRRDSKLDCGSCTISIAKAASKKIRAFICSMKFLSPEVALYLYKSTICPCMEHCCHIWVGAPSWYLELLDSLQKQICRTAGHSLTASLEPLTHHRIVISLCFSIGVTLVDVLQGWCNWFYFLFLVGGLLVILIDCMVFLSPFLDVTRMSMSKVFFLTQLDSRILCL